MKILEIAEFVNDLYDHKITKLEANKRMLMAFQEKVEAEFSENISKVVGAPVSPSQVDFSVPTFVIEAVNELIEKHKVSGGKSFTIKQEEILKLVIKKAKDSGEKKVTKKVVFDKKWLDFEDTFRSYGWGVKYNSPDYTENSFPPYFEFFPKE